MAVLNCDSKIEGKKSYLGEYKEDGVGGNMAFDRLRINGSQMLTLLLLAQ